MDRALALAILLTFKACSIQSAAVSLLESCTAEIECIETLQLLTHGISWVTLTVLAEQDFNFW